MITSVPSLLSSLLSQMGSILDTTTMPLSIADTNFDERSQSMVSLFSAFL